MSEERKRPRLVERSISEEEEFTLRLQQTFPHKFEPVLENMTEEEAAGAVQFTLGDNPAESEMNEKDDFFPQNGDELNGTNQPPVAASGGRGVSDFQLALAERRKTLK